MVDCLDWFFVVFSYGQIRDAMIDDLARELIVNFVIDNSHGLMKSLGGVFGIVLSGGKLNKTNLCRKLADVNEQEIP